MIDKERQYLLSLGLVLPENEQELKIFEESTFNQTSTISQEEIEPERILQKLVKSSNSLSKSQSFFRRSVLAAKIVEECHNERRFGSVKFQKLVYLCENCSKINFNTNYTKQAAGPFDNKFIHSIKKQFESQNWIKIEKVKENGFIKTVFTPLSDISNYRPYYDNYFSDDNESINYILSKFKSSLTDDVELVATIFYCWDEIICNNSILSDELIIKMIYEWNPSKKKFSESEIRNKISWMKKNSIYPVKRTGI